MLEAIPSSVQGHMWYLRLISGPLQAKLSHHFELLSLPKEALGGKREGENRLAGAAMLIVQEPHHNSQRLPGHFAAVSCHLGLMQSHAALWAEAQWPG